MPQAALGYAEELLLEGELLPDHLTGTAPAAGQPFVLPLDSRWLWRFTSVRFLLSTSAVVANRFASVDLCDPEGTPWIRNPALAVQAAGVAGQEYDFAQRALAVSGIAGQPQFASLARVWVLGGWQLRINVSALDVGDTLTGVRLYVDKFLPNPG